MFSKKDKNPNLKTDAKPISGYNINKYDPKSVSSSYSVKSSSALATQQRKEAFMTSSSTSSSAKYGESKKTDNFSASAWSKTSSTTKGISSSKFMTSTTLSTVHHNEGIKANKYLPTSFVEKGASTYVPIYSRDRNKYLSSAIAAQNSSQFSTNNLSSAEIAKWVDLKTNPALYKKPGANINSLQKNLIVGAVAAPIIASSKKDDSNIAKTGSIKPSTLISNNYYPKSTSNSSLSSTTTTAPIATNSSYAIERGSKGYLIIFNQEEFKDKTMNRQGSRRDEEALCATFYNYRFDPKIKRNLKYEEIQKQVQSISKMNFKNYSCFVAVILSHGYKDEIVHAYDRSFNINTHFVDPIAKNESLKGKPKIFIFGACKGNADPMRQYYDQVDAVKDSSTVGHVPYIRDILKCYSTYEGFVSYRDPSKGTLFIQTFCNILGEHGKTLSIEDILKQVNKKLTEGPNLNKQVPSFVSSMSANFCFGDMLK